VDRREIGAAAVAWTAAWVITALLIGVAGYESRDPDSQLYAGISARLVREPVSQWIAPQWWGFWNSEGPYCEHPVGMFVVPAVLGRLGYPPEQAAYAINSLYQIICFALVTMIAAAVTSGSEARALGSILQLLPIAFVFRVRANQEYAVLAGLLFALYATERARSRPPWALGMVAGFCAVLLVKGVFALMVPVVCALWLVSRWPGNEPRFSDRAAWAGIAAMPLAAVVVAWAYESVYVRTTGQSFLRIYQSRQIPEQALAGQSPVVRAAYTASWYLTRVVWYGFPWSVVAAAAGAKAMRRGEWLPWRGAGDGPDRRAAWFAIASGTLLTALFSLAHRKADRYIFPVYFLVAAAGAGTALRKFPWLARAARRADRVWVPAVLYVLLVLLTILSTGKLPQFTFWRT
jgi:4-amino-4-deoxy-L-arabinose transferase-like glycosyltransferase